MYSEQLHNLFIVTTVLAVYLHNNEIFSFEFKELTVFFEQNSFFKNDLFLNSFKLYQEATVSNQKLCN